MAGVIEDDTPVGPREQYATTRRLNVRSAVWRDDPQHGSPKDAALQAVTETDPNRVLEIGCGTGDFALRLGRMRAATQVVATDRSAGMVAAACAKGLSAHQVDVGRLPYADDSFDAVAALWMLYHVPELDSAFAEIRRVLAPGGVLVAATNGIEHTAELRALAGLAPAHTRFMTENARQRLAPHFRGTRIQRFAPRASLDHAAAVAYIDSFDPVAAARIPHFEGVREFRGSSCVIRAD